MIGIVFLAYIVLEWYFLLEDSVIGVARNSVFGVKACAINTTDSAFSVAKMSMVVFVA